MSATAKQTMNMSIQDTKEAQKLTDLAMLKKLIVITVAPPA
jgi:hypothetical protein